VVSARQRVRDVIELGELADQAGLSVFEDFTALDLVSGGRAEVTRCAGSSCSVPR
jgi:hypothetical protein